VKTPVRYTSAAGFSLLEMLIATTVMVAVIGAAVAVLDPAGATYGAQQEAAEIQQRLRVGVDALRRDLLMAGAGTYMSSGIGPLSFVFAPIVPHGVGAVIRGSPEDPQADVITIMYVPRTAAQCTLRTDLTSESGDVRVELRPGCPAADPLCGFRPGMRVVILDALGAYDVFTITDAQGDALHVQHRDRRFTTIYRAGALIAEVVSRTYYVDASVRTLYVYDAYRSNLPVLDHVVGLRFDYFGEPFPPAVRASISGPAALTTYGPPPPPVGVDNPGDDWGPGENCVFSTVAGSQIGRLADLSSGSPGLVALPYAQLRDGPWCPAVTNGAGAVLPGRFDADLLRVRRVRVTLRVEAADDALRGRNPPGRVLFAHPGTGRRAERFVPDQEVRFDVAPRNLNAGR
jgi:type II secretory pathway pseudopilin PulG